MTDRPVEVWIELGTAHGAVDEDDPPGDSHRRSSSRWRLAAAAAVLLLVCAGAAPARPPLGRTAALPVDAGASVSVSGDLLLVADPVALPEGSGAGGSADAALPQARTLTAYGLPKGGPRWTVDLPAAVSVNASLASGVVLVAERDAARRQAGTTALSASDGTQRWRRSGAVITVPDVGIGLVVSELRGVTGAGRRVVGEVEAIEIASGRSLWQTRVPVTAVAHVIGGERPVALLVHDSGRTEVRDLATGGIRALTTLPRTDYTPDNPRLVDGGFVLRHPEARGRRFALSAYDLDGLRQQWSERDRARDVRWAECGELLCARTAEGQWTLNLLDGALRYVKGDGLPWLPVRGSADQMLFRMLEDERLVVAEGGTSSAPRPLGILPAGTRDCRLGSPALVCRADDGAHLEIFALSR